MKILCSICARGGSKEIPNKNIKNLNGKPLLFYTIEQAKKSKIFDKILISTDSEKIKNLAVKYGAECIFKRPKALSKDNTPKIDVIKDLHLKAEKYFNKKYDIIYDLDVTSPLRTVSDIRKSYKLFLNSNADNLLSVCNARKNPYFNMLEYQNGIISRVKNLNIKIHSRQQAPVIFEMNASLYIWKRNILHSKKPFFREKTILYNMPFERSIDIDSISDWNLVKLLQK